MLPVSRLVFFQLAPEFFDVCFIGMPRSILRLPARAILVRDNS